MNENITLNREIRELKNEQILSKKIIEAEQSKIATQLKGDMGRDMFDVLSGKKTVKLSKLEIFKYKINFFINKILKAI